MGWSIGSDLAVGAYVFALVYAGMSDFLSLRIPNWLTGALAAAFPVAALLVGQDVHWLSHLEAGFGTFVVGAILFALRVMGGGDVKLLAAVALWVGLSQLLSFVVLTAFIGGAFALVVLLLRAPAVQLGVLALFKRLPPFAHENTPIPYGVPIAIAGIMLVPSLPFLG
jgi:prepilin peptidase CpaA